MENIFTARWCRATLPPNNLSADPPLPANDPCASRVIVNVPIKTSRYWFGPKEKKKKNRKKRREREIRGKGLKNVDVINFPFRSSARFASTDGKKRKRKKENEKERGKGVEEKENRIPRLGQAGAKDEFSAISLSVVAAQRGARHQRRVKVIAGGCTSPILALRAANKPFRLFDTRNSCVSRDPARRIDATAGWKENFAVGIGDWRKTSLSFFSFSSLSLSFTKELSNGTVELDGQRILRDN